MELAENFQNSFERSTTLTPFEMGETAARDCGPAQAHAFQHTSPHMWLNELQHGRQRVGPRIPISSRRVSVTFGALKPSAAPSLGGQSKSIRACLTDSRKWNKKSFSQFKTSNARRVRSRWPGRKV